LEKNASRIPSTMLNWVTATSRPRSAAGEISAMYMGDTTEAPPTPMPPTKRKSSMDHQSHARAVPTADTKYSAAIANNTRRRPKASVGRPTTIEPRMVPTRALATVKPRPKPLSP
jgi:hypothetical protein